MTNKILIFLLIVVIFFAGNDLLKGEVGILDHKGENIYYRISPFGRAEYNDLGVVDYKGIKLNLVTFKTKVLLLEDTETIYSDPQTLLPYRIERNISQLFGKEYITEEFDQKNFQVVITKYKGKKLVNTQVIKAAGPIQNVILLPFSLRNSPGLEIGWKFTARVPAEFKLELVSIDEIKVPAGKFQAYHFKSNPDKFEIWIKKDEPRVPLKIKGKGGLNYAVLMKKYNLPGNLAGKP